MEKDKIYESLFSRQHGKCLGCRGDLYHLEHSIDRHPLTNQIRGLLCTTCIQILGMVKEDQGYLYRLSAYLNRDPSKPMIYMIGSLRNLELTKVSARVRERGFIAFDNWISVGPHADDYWRDYEKEKGLSYTGALEEVSAKHVFYFDQAYLDMCDAALLVMPAGKSAHIELGYVRGEGKPGYILQDEEPERFDVMTQFANKGIYFNLDQVLDRITEDLDELKKTANLVAEVTVE